MRSLVRVGSVEFVPGSDWIWDEVVALPPESAEIDILAQAALALVATRITEA